MALRINEQPLQLMEPDAEIIIEVDNSEDTSQAVQIRLRDASQTDPAGNYRIRVSGDSLTIQRANAAKWGGADTKLTVQNGDTIIEAEGPNSIVFRWGLTDEFEFTNTTMILKDGANLQLGTGSGTDIGTSAGEKLGFYGAIPVAQQADFGAQTDNTGGTADDTLENVPTDTLANAVAAIENNEAGLAAAINDIRTVLRNLGLIA